MAIDEWVHVACAVWSAETYIQNNAIEHVSISLIWYSIGLVWYSISLIWYSISLIWYSISLV